MTFLRMSFHIQGWSVYKHPVQLTRCYLRRDGIFLPSLLASINFWQGRLIIYPAYPVGCIFFYFSKMLRTPFGGTEICIVPRHGQSKSVFKRKPRNPKNMAKNISYPLQYNDVIIIQLFCKHQR